MDLEDLVLLVRVRQQATNGSARDLRRRAGITIAEMAESVGVVESAISRWETGSRQPRGDAALRWARVLAELERANQSVAAA